MIHIVCTVHSISILLYIYNITIQLLPSNETNRTHITKLDTEPIQIYVLKCFGNLHYIAVRIIICMHIHAHSQSMHTYRLAFQHGENTCTCVAF